MQIKLFVIPIGDNGTNQDDLNRFLRTHKVLELENHLVHNEKGSWWCFCVKFVEDQSLTTDRIKVDYKVLLDDKTFQTFSKLREIRKQIAIEDGIPAYAVFTDEELAGLAKLTDFTPKSMLTVKGIGDKKVERFAEKFINKFNS